MYVRTTLLVHLLGAEYKAQCPTEFCDKTLDPGWLFDTLCAFWSGVIGSIQLDNNRAGVEGRSRLSLGSACGDENGPVNLYFGLLFHPKHVKGILAT
jgi:hypothetical protein